MMVLDVNLLIYAVNEDSPDHKKARSWLEVTIGGTETVGLPWIVLLAFLRHRGLMASSSIFTRRDFFSTVERLVRSPGEGIAKLLGGYPQLNVCHAHD